MKKFLEAEVEITLLSATDDLLLGSTGTEMDEPTEDPED